MPSDIQARLRKQQARIKRLQQKSPLEGIRTTGNTELDDAAEAKVIEAKLEASIRQQQQMLKHLNGKVHHFIVLFPSEIVCEEFLAKAGWRIDPELGVVDGVALAQALGIQLSQHKIPFKAEQADRRLIEEVGLIE